MGSILPHNSLGLEELLIESLLSWKFSGPEGWFPQKEGGEERRQGHSAVAALVLGLVFSFQVLTSTGTGTGPEHWHWPWH
jgi:hypothetical protein